jgi:hypothetical protein
MALGLEPKARLSFTPGFSRRSTARNFVNRFNGLFLFLPGRRVEWFEESRRAKTVGETVERLLRFSRSLITGLKPGVNESQDTDLKVHI